MYSKKVVVIGEYFLVTTTLNEFFPPLNNIYIIKVNIKIEYSVYEWFF